MSLFKVMDVSLKINTTISFFYLHQLFLGNGSQPQEDLWDFSRTTSEQTAIEQCVNHAKCILGIYIEFHSMDHHFEGYVYYPYFFLTQELKTTSLS